jgi:hydantoinase/carbamoylase family amidase
MDIRIDADRVTRRLEALSAIGRDARGGMSRFSFTPAHAQACLLVAGWMQEAGLQPAVDGAGNLIGVGPGRGAAISAGSHLDTVPMGGMYDGALGVVGAVECAQALRDAGAALRRPYAALAFADEEGHTFGIGCLTSRAVVGELSEERMRAIRDRDGRTLAERAAAWDCPLPRRAAPALAAYLELHIEQGPRLHAEGLDAAAATAIAGISRTTVTFTGQANHAGTTPMTMRRDALWGAATLVLDVRRLALDSDGATVATVGRIDVDPGATNVVPGAARVRVEVRSGEEARLARLRADVEAAAERAAAAFALQARVDPWDTLPPQPLDDTIHALALRHAARRGLRAVSMPSWAGHDAKILAPHLPAGLLFVPSRDGISHSPAEFTPPAQIAAGVQWLMDTLTALDAALPRA